jgi:hypothetical protein
MVAAVVAVIVILFLAGKEKFSAGIRSAVEEGFIQIRDQDEGIFRYTPQSYE